MENEKNVGTENKTEGGNSVTVTEKQSLKDKIVGMVNELDQENATIYELKAKILRESDKETKKALKDQLKIHKKNAKILIGKLVAIPIGILVSLGLLAMVVSAIKGKKKQVVNTTYEEVDDSEEEIEDDYEDEDDESDEDSDDDSVEE